MQRINHLSFSVLTCLLTCLLASCAGSQANDSSAQASSLKAASAFDTPPQATMSGVMQSKLVHSQALLDGLVVSDYTKIEGNALALKRISEGGEWIVNDSAAYFAMSSRFREICDQMAGHARAKQLDAASDDFAVLTHTCVACHTYLRAERAMKGMPGRISMLPLSVSPLSVLHQAAESLTVQ